MAINRVFNDIRNELARAGQKYAPEFASMNEALGTIRAEYCELEDTIVLHRDPARIREEAIQVAAMAIKLVRYIDEKDAFDRSAEYFEEGLK